jgi:hypothetical protein
VIRDGSCSLLLFLFGFHGAVQLHRLYSDGQRVVEIFDWRPAVAGR